MRKKFIIIIIMIIVASLIIGLRSLRQSRKEIGNVLENSQTKKTHPTQDLGDCTVSGFTKDTQVYKQVLGVDSNLLSLDIYVPKTKGSCDSKYPIMIYVHGGGWQIGDKAGQITNKSKYFTSRGYVFVSVNYRLAPAVKYPVFNEDVAAATRWVYDNASKYSANNNNITIMGHSAGGGIISAVSTDEKYLRAVNLPLDTFKCAIALDTEGYNIVDKAAENTRVYEAPFGSDEKVWVEASPINHISANKGIPSFFIVTRGNKDRVNRAITFQKKLMESNIIANIIEVPSLDHEGVNAAVGDPGDRLVTSALQKFLDTNCK